MIIVYGALLDIQGKVREEMKFQLTLEVTLTALQRMEDIKFMDDAVCVWDHRGLDKN